MTPEQQAAYERFKAAQDAFFETLMTTAPSPAAPAPTPAVPATRPRLQAPFTRPVVAPPRPSMPAPKPGTVLTDQQRKEHLPAAKAVALKILKVIGDNAQLVPGVTGQLALERIPYDPTLVQQAIDAARREL